MSGNTVLKILDRFINDQLKAIEDTKVTSKRRKGIVLFIRIFPRFVERIEHTMNGADKLEIRNIVNSGYEKIVKMMFDCLEAISKYEESIADDREQLNAHIMTLAYAKSVVRRPFGKLLEFFEGIESLLRTTSAPEEVGFRLKYNKKRHDSLYKRVDKHFTEEEGLLQVVWRSIEEEVIRCHERFTSIINKSYPDSNISLEFSIDDLLNYFSELARSHWLTIFCIELISLTKFLVLDI
ncbi:12709_t:CDS:2 [Gigaspora rosea]|nr:12709_t:CDS:2 [Gigaspora rosea]